MLSYLHVWFFFVFHPTPLISMSYSCAPNDKTLASHLLLDNSVTSNTAKMERRDSLFPLNCLPFTSLSNSSPGSLPALFAVSYAEVGGWSCSFSFHTALPSSTEEGQQAALWTQHLSGVSVWGQAHGLLFSGLLLHYWIRELPQNRTQPRGNMQIWWINILQWSSVEGKREAKGHWIR